MIGVQKQKLNLFVHILIDSEPDPSMILCKSSEDAEKLVSGYFIEAQREIDRQFGEAIAKIRSKQ